MMVQRVLATLSALMIVTAVAPRAAQASIAVDAESPINGAFEFKLGITTPDIDAEYIGEGAYERTFGNRTMLNFELEFDGYFWQGVGALGAFGSIGHASVRANAVNEDGTRNSTDRTRLRTMPMRAGLVYRFDELAERYNVPLAFSAKAGLDWYLWWVSSSNGIADHEPAEGGGRTVGRGGTLGWHASFGAHFLLDALAPRMAQSFDNNTGINNTYLFAELTIARVNDFGSASSWDLSDTMAMFGLAFEF